MSLNKIYRGGVHKTTPETTEVQSASDASLKAGHVVQLVAGKATKQAVTAANSFVYVVGEKLHHGIDQEQGTDGDSVRLYVPKSGDLFAIRAAAGITIANDMPLSINADGRAITAVATEGSETEIIAYVDLQAHGSLSGFETKADDLIPVKFK